LGILGAILTALLYAVGTTVLQVGIEGVDPIAGNLIRVVVGSVAFLPVIAAAAIRKIRIPSKRATTYIIIAAFFGMAVGSLLYVAAVAMTGATIISVISSTAPLYAVPVSVFFLKEKLTKVAGVGILATIVGVVLVVVGL
jgi:drug/metabolite transporter (DMT)-like permease